MVKARYVVTLLCGLCTVSGTFPAVAVAADPLEILRRGLNASRDRDDERRREQEERADRQRRDRRAAEREQARQRAADDADDDARLAGQDESPRSGGKSAAKPAAKTAAPSKPKAGVNPLPPPAGQWDKELDSPAWWLQQAEAALTAAAGDNPADGRGAEAATRVARVHARMGDLAAASRLAVYRRDRANFYLELALDRAKAGDAEGAEQLVQLALAQFRPDDAEGGAAADGDSVGPLPPDRSEPDDVMRRVFHVRLRAGREPDAAKTVELLVAGLHDSVRGTAKQQDFEDPNAGEGDEGEEADPAAAAATAPVDPVAQLARAAFVRDNQLPAQCMFSLAAARSKGQFDLAQFEAELWEAYRPHFRVQQRSQVDSEETFEDLREELLTQFLATSVSGFLAEYARAGDAGASRAAIAYRMRLLQQQFDAQAKAEQEQHRQAERELERRLANERDRRTLEQNREGIRRSAEEAARRRAEFQQESRDSEIMQIANEQAQWGDAAGARATLRMLSEASAAKLDEDALALRSREPGSVELAQARIQARQQAARGDGSFDELYAAQLSQMPGRTYDPATLAALAEEYARRGDRANFEKVLADARKRLGQARAPAAYAAVSAARVRHSDRGKAATWATTLDSADAKPFALVGGAEALMELNPALAVAGKSRTAPVGPSGPSKPSGPTGTATSTQTPDSPPEAGPSIWDAAADAAPAWARGRETAAPVEPPAGWKSFVLAQGGARLAFVAQKGRKWNVVVDGKAGKGYDEIVNLIALVPRNATGGPQARVDVRGQVIFSADAAHYTYLARDGLAGFVLVVDGRAVDCAGIEPARFIQFSPDFSRVAFVTRDEQGVEQLVFADTAPDGQRVAETLPRSLAGRNVAGLNVWFVPGSRRVVRMAESKKGRGSTALAVDGRELPFQTVDAVTFSPDGSRYAWMEQRRVNPRGGSGGRDEPFLALSDGKAYGPYTRFDGVTFSPDSRRVAFSSGQQCVVDGRPGKKYERAGEPVFSPDSKRVAYVATAKGKQVVVVDGAEGPVEDLVMVGPVFSPDSMHVAYVTPGDGGNGWRVVLDGHQSPTAAGYAPRSIRFTPDSKHVLCEWVGAGHLVDAVDKAPKAPGAAQPARQDVSGIAFGGGDGQDGGKFHYLAYVPAPYNQKDAKQFYQVDVEVVPADEPDAAAPAVVTGGSSGKTSDKQGDEGAPIGDPVDPPAKGPNPFVGKWKVVMEDALGNQVTDIYTFTADSFTSAAAAKQGVKALPYEVQDMSAALAGVPGGAGRQMAIFTVKNDDAKKGTMTWFGTFDGEKVTGMMMRAKPGAAPAMTQFTATKE